MWLLPRKLSSMSLKKEREHVKHNEQLLEETLRNPDYIREYNEDPNVYFYIKKTQKYYLEPDIATVNVRRFRYFTVRRQKPSIYYYYVPLFKNTSR